MADPAIPAEAVPGAKSTKTYCVREEHTAKHLGSGSIEVYATPAMVLHMEETALSLIDPLLPQGQATVGIDIHAKHLAATPLGMNVRIEAELTSIEGRILNFNLVAFDEKDRIGEATHSRAIIDIARFAARLKAKSGL